MSERPGAAANAGIDPPGASPLLEGIDLVIFDKDGTLIDFHEMWGGWVRALADSLELETGAALRDPLFEVLGVDPATGLVAAHGLLAATPMARIREVVTAVVRQEAATTPEEAETAVAAAWLPPDPETLARPLADLVELLGALRRSGRQVAIATSDDRDPTERTAAALGIEGLLDAMVCADDGGAVKPAPAAVLRICRELGVLPDRTAVVGDSTADLAMGRTAGVARVIAVLTGVGTRTELAPLADVVIDSIAELRAAIS